MDYLNKLRNLLGGAGQAVGNAVNQGVNNVKNFGQGLIQNLTQPVSLPQTQPVINLPQLINKASSLVAPDSLAGKYIQNRVANFKANPPSQLFDPQRNLKSFSDFVANAPQPDPYLPPNLDLGPVASLAGKFGGKLLAQTPQVNTLLGQAGKINLGAEVPIVNDAAQAVKGFGSKLINGAKTVLPTIEQAPKKVGAVQYLLDRTRNIIGSQGPAGQELAARLKAARDTAETAAGNWTLKMPTVRGLNPQEFTNFVDTAEGKAQALSPKIAQAVQEWAGVRNEIYNTAKNSGVDIGKLENYFPHRFDPKMFEGDGFNKLVDHLVQSGQAPNTDEAAKMVRYAGDIVRNRRQGNLEISRLFEAPYYDKTKNALFDYVSQASHRIGQVQHLGPDDATAMSLINNIGQSGGDATAAKEAFDVASGAKKYSDMASNISGKLRGFQAVTKLGLGAITNAGQSVNTAVVTGPLKTLTAGFKAFTPEAQNFALKSGVTLDGVIQDLREGSGFSGKVIGKITAPGFNSVEKFNRTVAAWAGKGYAEDLAQKAARGDMGAAGELLKMGIRDFGNGVLSEADQIKAARNIVERTQFKVNPQDLPGWASSPFGKLLNQFHSFSYNQSAFFGREILSPLKKGNVAPLVRFLTIGALAGEGIADTKATLRNRERPTGFARLADDINTVGGAGIVQDAYNAMQRGPDGVMSFIAGPTAGEASKLIGGVGLASQGKPKTLGKQVLSDIPIVGQTISNTAFPAKNAYQSRTPDLPIETASAAESNPGTAPVQKLSILQKKKIEQQITDINAKEKKVFNKGGAITLPLVGQIAGSTDDQKTTQLNQLEAQKKALQAQLANPTTQKEAEYSLAVDKFKRTNDYAGWTKATTDYVSFLKDYQSQLDPVGDKTEVLRLQNKIGDLQTQLDKYGTQGGFKKGKKLSLSILRKFKVSKPARSSSIFKTAKLGTTKTLKAPQLSTPKTRLGSFKLPNTPVTKITAFRKPTKQGLYL